MVRKCVLWALTVAVAGVIFFFSHQPVGQSSQLSAGLTDSVVEHVLQIPNITEVQHLRIDQYLRDFAHIGLFAALGFVTSLLVRCYTRRYYWFLTASLPCAVYALLDECHQLWRAAGRAFEWSDVGKDCFGVILGVSIVAVFSLCAMGIRIYRQKKGN